MAPASVAGWQEPGARAGLAKTEDQALEVAEDSSGKREVRADFVGALEGAPVVAVVAAVVGASVDVFVWALFGVSAGAFGGFDGVVVEVSAAVGTAVEKHWPPGGSGSEESARALTRTLTLSQR